jgi:hypothetical protein
MKKTALLMTITAAILVSLACIVPIPAMTTQASPTTTASPQPSPTATRVIVPTVTSIPLPTFTPAPVARKVTTQPAGNPHPLRITDSIHGDFKDLGLPATMFLERIVWVKDLKFDYQGGTVLLSGDSTGLKPLMVDDMLTLQIVHTNGNRDTFIYDFGKNGNSLEIAGPFDITEFCRPGLNLIYIQIFDYGYSGWGTDGLWIVEYK